MSVQWWQYVGRVKVLRTNRCPLCPWALKASSSLVSDRHRGIECLESPFSCAEKDILLLVCSADGGFHDKQTRKFLIDVHQRTRRTGAQFRKNGVVLEGLGTVFSREGVFLRIQFFFLHPTSYSFFQTYETFFFRIIINIRYSARVVVVLLRI